MPSIGLRITPQAGAGMAAGLQRAREIRNEQERIQFDRDEHEFLQGQREKSAAEERAAHVFYEDAYSSMVDDETKSAAYAGLPLEIKASVLKQEQAQQRMKSMLTSIGSDLQYLAANPRYQHVAESAQMRLQAGGDFSKISEELKQAKRAAAEEQAVTMRATKTLGGAQTWLQSIVDPASPLSGEIDKYDLAAVHLAISNLGAAIERSQDPNMPPLDPRELRRMEVELTKAKIPPNDYMAIEDEIQARLMQEINEIFYETLGAPPIETRPGPPDPRGGEGEPPAEDPERRRGMEEMRQVGPGGDEFTRVLGQVQEQAERQQAGGAQGPAQPAGSVAPKERRQGAQPPPQPPTPDERPTASGRPPGGQPFPTDHPMVRNEDGTQSNVLTITAEIDGRHYVIPSMVGGKQLSDDEAVRVAEKKGLEKYPSFATAEEALSASKDLHDKQAPPAAPRLAVPWKSPTKAGVVRRPITEAKASGEVYDRLISDLVKILTEQGKDAFNAAATQAGLQIDEALGKVIAKELKRRPKTHQERWDRPWGGYGQAPGPRR